ncbi:MAG TPA: GH116 family glycosyl-hydrolase [Chthonomonadaceae bacterium]|nr:GH116 family glycosyl-hydrolase [Chthonomonadaceae bacterium]
MEQERCSAPYCGCSPIPRRDFLALSGFAVAGLAMNALPVMAGPFAETDFEKLIPPDKKLHPDWVKSLFARGERTVYTKTRGELKHIGMPVGGICCGTLYLGGDGKLWLWDIFNANQNGIEPRTVRWDGFGNPGTVDPQNGANYVSPAEPKSPLEQGFALKVNGAVRPMDSKGWEEIRFQGEYPIGTIHYSDTACPVQATLTAYSPFLPLNADDSGLPVTVCEFALKNVSAKPVTAEVGGVLENASALFTARPGSGSRVNTVRKSAGVTLVASHFDRTPPEKRAEARPDILVDDFEHADYGKWRVEGTAFGSGPVERSAIPGYQGDVGGLGNRVVNSHASAPGASVQEKDSHTDKLTSPPFPIQRRYLTFFIGGGANIEEVGLRLLVDGKVVRRAAGRNDNHMRQEVFDVAEFAGRQAVIEIYDNGRGGWGNVGVDHILQTDAPRIEIALEKAHDYGTMALAILGAGVGKASVRPETLFEAPVSEVAKQGVEEKLLGGMTRAVALAPGQTQTVTFLIAWHFPNSGLGVPDAREGNYYARRFADATAVVEYVAKEYSRLSRITKLWHETWYDSTLPFWFLDRTFVNTSILATTTSHRFGTGRFWGWEGIGCCPGTCTHVWHYAQAVSRIFPEIERGLREHVDFGVGFDPGTGMIRHRGEGTGPAVDGQCGRILGVYREHQMSADDAFLRRVWPRVQEAIRFLIHHDTDGDGLLDGAQENTLDAAWFGKIAWISSLYAAALKAGQRMATAVGDTEFARVCGQAFARTQHAIETELFHGEYFIQKPEPGHEKSLGTYQTCHIDQVQGQSWAWQVGLGRVLDRDKTVSALKALYKYNFTPDVGPFRRKNRPGRPYAVAGDGGLIMATNPKELPDAFGNVADWQYGYFNECMSGFEHQAASHMIAEGLLLEGLAVTRAIHDRYHASRRNPYNEIECSDHYSRAMASYGSFISICGFEVEGLKGYLGFDPRWNAERFKAAFTAPEGWGTFSQQRTDKSLAAEVHLKYGRLFLKTLALQGKYTSATAKVGGRVFTATVETLDGRAIVTFKDPVLLQEGQALSVTLT